MPAFRRVQGEQAGPGALGILVPPGRRTVVIVRPRSLDWDLLLISPEGDGSGASAIWEVSRDEGAGLARDLHRALEDRAGDGPVRVEPVASGEGYHVRAGIGKFTLIACARVPGKPYRAMVVGTVREALDAAARITAFLSPQPDGEQELYFNTMFFSR